MLRNPAAKAIAVNGIDDVSMSTRAVVGPLRAGDGERPGAELVGDHAIEVAIAEVQPAGEAGDSLAIDDSVIDQPHRPSDDVTSHVPLR